MGPDGWPLRRGGRLGVVASFEDERGLGRVAEDNGTTYDFHCTAIVDGTRAIEVGQAVLFVVVPGHRGRLEASQLVKC